MAVTNYYSVNGRLRGEDTSGTRLGYLTDALGSVTATIASDGVVQNTYRYKPYGQQLAKTGVGVDPKFQHAGDTGSRKTGLDYSEQYNQYRHLDASTGRWTTVDVLWPDESAFVYVRSNPTKFVDPRGSQQVSPKVYQPPLTVVEGGGGGVEIGGGGEGIGAPALAGGDAILTGCMNAMQLEIYRYYHSQEFEDQIERIARDVLREWERSARCQDIYEQYKKDCNQPRSCKDITDCKELRKRHDAGARCASGRYAVLSLYDEKPPPNWRARPCGHAHQFCEAMQVLCNCASTGRREGCPGTWVSERQCAATKALCNAQRIVCNSQIEKWFIWK